MYTDSKKKHSCTRCRQSKRRCDGENPCGNCVRKNVFCDYNHKDRRHQRSSIGYVKSLENNNKIYESTILQLISLQDDPKQLQEKLASLSTTFPMKENGSNIEEYSDEVHNYIGLNASPSEKAIVDLASHYFGPGSLYHVRNISKPDTQPLIRSGERRSITLEEDFDYVAGLVRYFFENQTSDPFSFILDKGCILDLLARKKLDDHFLCQELVYAICANCSKLLYKDADSYRDMAISKLFMDNLKSSVSIAQTYILLAVHDFSKGQISNGWILSGIGFRCGTDIGFDMAGNEDSCLQTNRLYVGAVILDFYFSLTVGRRPTVFLNKLPIFKLPLESEKDFLTVRYSAELVELSRSMFRSTYQPIMFDKDAKINYLMKFNRCKGFNIKLLKWRADLSSECYWLYSSLKSSRTLATDNHALKFMFYFVLIFLNKPFLHIPKEHSTAYIIEDIAKEVYLIVSQRLERFGGEANNNDQYTPTLVLVSEFLDTDNYRWASMDVCMITVLSHMLVTLITTQPKHYLYLEKHFKLFARYLNLFSARKYKAKDNPIQRLYEHYMNFKSKYGSDDPDPPRYEMEPLRRALDSDAQNLSEYSDSHSSRLGVNSDTSTSSPEKSKAHQMESNAEPTLNTQQILFENVNGVMAPDTQDNSQMRITEPTQVEPNQMNWGSGVPPEQMGFEMNSWNDNFYQPVVELNQPYFSYEQLPPVQDPIGDMLNSFFKNTGQEYLLRQEPLDWASLYGDMK